MSQELIERIEKFRERGCDTETHVLLCDCRDELTKQAERVKALEEVIKRFQFLAKETLPLWDKDDDMKVGKRLKALAGLSPGYWPDFDKQLAAVLKEGE